MIFPPLQFDGKNKPLIINNLHGLAIPLAIAELQQQLSCCTVVIADSVQQSQVLEREIAWCTQSDNIKILHFPSWDTLPYDVFSPNPEIISERLDFLHHIQSINSNTLLVIPVQNLMQKIPNPEYISSRTFMLKIGDHFDMHKKRSALEKNGYLCVNEVRETGEFSIRGGVFDIFPSGSHQAYRIELFDDEIESIRTFSTETQLSIERISEIRLMPANEYPFDEGARQKFLAHFREHFHINTAKSAIYQDVRKGNRFAGIEYYLPFFHQQLTHFFSYLPEGTTFIHCTESLSVMQTWQKQIQARFEDRKHDTERPLIEPEKLYLTATETNQLFNQHNNIYFNSKGGSDQHQKVHAKTTLPKQYTEAVNAKPLDEWLSTFTERILICADSLGRQDAILRKLKKEQKKYVLVDSISNFTNSQIKRAITVAPIISGTCLKTSNMLFFDEGSLFGSRANRTGKSVRFKANPNDIISNLTDLHLGSPIVHIDHGIGRYRGLKQLDYDGQAEYLELEYLGGDKLFVPVSSLHLVSRYTGANEENAPWHRLGNDQWQNIKQKATKKIRDVAAELLSLYAKRESQKGFGMKIDQTEYEKFCQGFPFEETNDQLKAIEAVEKDLMAAKHMDRVVCGDVGFGKTEIALRAAFIAANDSHQVVMLVPTTLLAQQHFENFLDRFSPFPIQVALLSRFVSNKESKQTLIGLQSGHIDIVIGTHKLLQKDIKFKNLGLMIIDEEHRFGVKQKEHLKSLRTDVDILTLTATPIPRTLNTALSGLRDLSIIATPPKSRLSIKTEVLEWQNNIIREACQREIQRGGQVYFLHNEVQTIGQMAESIQKINPDARVRAAHGQMPEQELQKIMVDFYKQRFNILVCTTIIESGIDIPTANTIIINRADKLGLAQLHQLRGRVGRSHHKAFAFLIIPGWKSITADAKKRLQAIESLEDLGSGFTLATHDMEIRGAGELLGEGQSGQIQSIGFDLYCTLLDRAVNALQQGEDIDILDEPDKSVEIELNIPALIPEDYVFDVFTRLTLYKRMNSAQSNQALDALRVELIDRFGLLPESTADLFEVLSLKLQASQHHISSVVMNDEFANIHFSNQPQKLAQQLISLIQKEPQTYKPLPNNGIKMLGDFSSAEQRINATKQLFDILEA